MRILAIGDVHGCSIALRTLLNTVQPGSDDIVITLGDYVDRGPDSKGVLDILLELEKTTQLKPLTGNHEILFLDAMAGQVDPEAWLRVGGRETLISYAPEATVMDWRQVTPAHVEFLSERCLRHWETEHHLFVHANANSVFPLSEQSDDWLFWTRFDDSFPHVSGKMMVCGHTAQKNGIPALKPQAICLDTWAYGEGWLTCLDVTTGEFVQANQAGVIKTFTMADLLGDPPTATDILVAKQA
ncbi:serine/threonine protein phosphatase 1 [Prosthecobacter fusiformis]|uniref:Serine/threonine protein phosphatase 1 n=1 Tax=Prosthecobacter fusiformis TaxID=48464 RepID=A0A4R7S461_9BACT|nr:metallophosphoesterase family protein [Prosthecobacter fusiformis]TDU73131.1 serine/threonine protein phosphatase 1 [Prosthecobacter fusiformis]